LAQNGTNVVPKTHTPPDLAYLMSVGQMRFHKRPHNTILHYLMPQWVPDLAFPWLYWQNTTGPNHQNEKKIVKILKKMKKMMKNQGHFNIVGQKKANLTLIVGREIEEKAIFLLIWVCFSIVNSIYFFGHSKRKARTSPNGEKKR
jgi:hypothetical protein